MNILDQLPIVRRDGLTIQTVGREILVFDSANDTAHALNAPAAFVWQLSDGTHTVDEIAEEMSRELSVEADARTVWFALDQLNRRNLIESQLNVPSPWAGMTRRQFLGRAAAGAALLAVVTSIATPSPAHAQSGCLGQGVDCENVMTLCCDGYCCCTGAGPTCETFCC